MRQRSQTIGTLGRAPARNTNPNPPTPAPSSAPPPPERGLVRRWLHGALLENMGLKFLSMVLAVTVFLLINTDRDRENSVLVRVKFEYPPDTDKILTKELKNEVRVTLKGPSRRVRNINDGELGPISLDLRMAPTADIPITPDMVTNVPTGLTIVSIIPRSIHVEFDNFIERTVEVTPVLTGRPQHGYVVAEVKATPPTIKVRGGARQFATLANIRTTDVSLEDRTDSFEELAGIATPEGLTVDPTQRIGVQVRIVEELVTRKIPDLVITPRGEGVDKAKWSITPAQVEVTLTGTLLAVEKARSMMAPIVKLTPGDLKSRDVDVTIEGLPPGVGIKISPERVKIAPVKPSAPPP